VKNAALALVLNSQNEVLLVKRKDVPIWVLPGGGIEDGETPELASLRETAEETGISVSIVDHIATYAPVNAFTSTIYVFLCRAPASSPTRPQDQEASEVRFFSQSALPPSLFPPHATFIHEWQTAPLTPIIRPLTELSYWSIIQILIRHPWWSLKYLWTRYLHCE
jgi:ADP-ribose pyrophosphatase YjhB (NUDIX family)